MFSAFSQPCLCCTRQPAAVRPCRVRLVGTGQLAADYARILRLAVADGNNVVDSGTPSSMFPGKDRVRFVSRVRAYVHVLLPLAYEPAQAVLDMLCSSCPAAIACSLAAC